MNMKKRLLSGLLALLLAVSLAAAGAQPAFAEEAAGVDPDHQLALIQSQIGKLKQKDAKNTWYYTVTDLDHDGCLEFVAASQHPEDRSTNLKVWEVSQDGQALTACKLDKDEDESFPDILTDCTDTYYDPASGTWSYLLYDNIVLSDTEVYTIKTSVSLKDGVVGYNAYAVEHIVVDGANWSVTHTDATGIAISPEEYNAAGVNAFANAARSSTSFEWLTGEDAGDLAHLTDSYAVFMGRKAPTEVFPVQKPAALQAVSETPAPTAPAATAAPVVPAAPVMPAPQQDTAPVYLTITKNPTNESKKTGGTALFVACANVYDSLEWRLVSPDGGEYSARQVAYMWADAPISGYYSTTLSIGNVAPDMNGWGAYCIFNYRGQTARTSTAYISVGGSAPAPVPDGGTYYGHVTEWNSSTVAVNLDGTTIAALPWNICNVSGEIYVGAPATVSWSGTTTKGLNYTYCYIEGSAPAPQPQYGSMSGTAHEGGGGFAIDLVNGSQVFVDGWNCNVSGSFYEGASCIVYYTDYPSNDNVYQADIFGSEPVAPGPVYTGNSVDVNYGYSIYSLPTHQSFNPDGTTYEAIWCPDCGTEVSLAMESCPVCGRGF